jgi:hypothetical protein
VTITVLHDKDLSLGFATSLMVSKKKPLVGAAEGINPKYREELKLYLLVNC